MGKDIDSKPFYDSLTRIMTDAFRFAKAGKSVSGTGPVTGKYLHHKKLERKCSANNC